MKKMNFSKLMALVVAILMIASVVPMGAFAADVTPNGTPITSAEEFAAMKADGNYYLANNITLMSTYASEFSGTFDGNGKTITINCPIFDKVTNGTVKNFTVNSVAKTLVVANGGAAVCNVAKGATFKDITCNASITSTNIQDAHGLAAIVGTIAGNGSVETTITIENCVNTGNLKGDKAKTHAGAMIGYAVDTTNAQTVNIIIKDCRNEGKIDASKSGGMISYVQGVKSVTVIGCYNSGEMFSHGISAGIIAQVHKQCQTLYVENCTNSGKAYGENNGYNGGIVGICQIVGDALEHTRTVTFRSCFNSGNVIGKGTDSCGGIVGRHYGAIMEYCGNSGQIENANCVGGIVGYTQNANLIRYCYNVGTIKSMEYSSGIVGASTNPIDTIYGCYNSGVITMQDGHKDAYNIAQVVSAIKPNSYGTYYNNFSKAGILSGTAEIPCVSLMLTPLDDDNYKFNEADLASGKLAFDINNALGETRFYQNLGGAKDAYPVSDSTHGAVIKAGNVYCNFSFATADTAATSIGNNGLKFTTAINKVDYDALISAGIVATDITVGTMITLEKYVDDAFINYNKSFNIADFEEIEYAYVNSVGTLAEKDGSYIFEGAIVNIPESKLDTTYCAIGYVKIGDNIYYSATYAERSVADVAEAAYADRAEAQSGEYTNAIAANSSVAIGDTASYSPYTEAQLTELKTKFGK